MLSDMLCVLQKCLEMLKMPLLPSVPGPGLSTVSGLRTGSVVYLFHVGEDGAGAESGVTQQESTGWHIYRLIKPLMSRCCWYSRSPGLYWGLSDCVGVWTVGLLLCNQCFGGKQ